MLGLEHTHDYIHLVERNISGHRNGLCFHLHEQFHVSISPPAMTYANGAPFAVVDGARCDASRVCERSEVTLASAWRC